MFALSELNNDFVEAILSDVSSYFVCNLSKDTIPDGIFRKFDDVFVQLDDQHVHESYSEFMKHYAQKYIVENSNRFLAFSDRRRLLSEYRAGTKKDSIHYHCSYSDSKDYFFEMTLYIFQSKDDKDIYVISTLKDETVQIQDRRKSEFRDIIINSLSVDFAIISYINLDKGEVTNFRCSKLFLPFQSKADKKTYNERIELFAQECVFDTDRKKFLFHMSKESIISALSLNPVFVFNFRISIDGSVKYYEIKIIKNYTENNEHNIVLGIRNVDQETRNNIERNNTIEGMILKSKLDRMEMNEKDFEKERRDEELVRNHQIIEILASEYSSVYYIDLPTDKLTTYSMNDDVERDLGGIFRKGIRFSDAYDLYVNKYIYEDDKDMMHKAGSIDSIVTNLTNQKSYSVNFRSVNEGNPHYCEMKFVKVGNDSVPTAVALAFADKDNEIRRENERKLQLEEAKARAEAANKAKSSFLFNMSHDIRTPMNAIMGFANMASKYIDDKQKVYDCLEKIKLSGDHLVNLINDVLDMSRIESGKVTIEEKNINMGELANSIITIVQANATANNLTIEKKFYGLKDANICADDLRLNQILINVIGNSIKYTKPGGKIILSIRKLSSMKPGYMSFEIKVTDNGIGMSKEFVKTIFESFSREKTSTVSGIQGTGLGMAITKQLVNMMDGSIDVESELGIGTTVTMRFSFRKSVDTQSIEDEDIYNGIDIHGIKILLVEDNELNREIAKDILEDEGVIVDEAEDGSVAVEMIKDKKNDYDIILMDIQMPYMDGYTATQEIRRLPGKKAKTVPIIAMTANAFSEDKIKALESGMNDHLTKPINVSELFKKIRKYTHGYRKMP